MYKINDPVFDLDSAYETMEKQDNKCKICRSDFTVENAPSVVKQMKEYHFLGMHTMEVKFNWICSYCSSPEIKLEDMIADLVKMEEQEM